jgi:sporulation protein YlmC with PRC-barrel domain
MLKLTVASCLATALALPVMAQTPANQSNAALNAPATRDTGGNASASPSARNDVLTDAGGMRASKIVGTSVYNDKDEKVGSIDDLIIGTDRSLHAVIDVGGVMGIGGKMVAVPFEKLQFTNVKGSSDNHVVMPGATKDGLGAMPEYHYAARG